MLCSVATRMARGFGRGHLQLGAKAVRPTKGFGRGYLELSAEAAEERPPCCVPRPVGGQGFRP